MASRYGRPVYLCGGALQDALPRDIDVRVVLSTSEFEARFGKTRGDETHEFMLEAMDDQRRWHVEIAKMNKAGTAATHLPIDFQVQALAAAVGYVKERRVRLDDVPELVSPWED